jgi:hypothetical protein
MRERRVGSLALGNYEQATSLQDKVDVNLPPSNK